MSLPPLPPGWIYKPRRRHSALPALLAATQMQDLLLVVTHGDLPVFEEIARDVAGGKPLAMYEHLLLRLNPLVLGEQAVWPSADLFISSWIPDAKRQQIDGVGRKNFDPPLVPSAAPGSTVLTPASQERLRELLDGPDMARWLDLVERNLRLSRYFARSDKSTPLV